jgi:DNA replication initiation complex subunit (GINS family)
LYNEIYAVWNNEKENRNELQTLPRGFYDKVASYIKKMSEASRMLDNKSPKAKLLDIELKNVKVMVGELLGLRYTKIQEKVSVQETVVRGALTEEEKTLCDGVFPLAEAYNFFSNDVLGGRLSQFDDGSEQVGVVVVRFVQEIPALVGADLKTYGPFCPEDIASLPLDNARLLVKQGAAVKVDSK